MRIVLLSIYIVFLSINFTTAQDRNIYKYIGAVGTGDLHWITKQNTYGSEHINGKLTWGYGYGAKFGIDINNKHKFEIAGIYSFFGQNRRSTINEIEYEKKLKLTYYALPITYKFVLGDVSQFFRSDFQLFATTGLRFSYLANINTSYSIAELPVGFKLFHTINNTRLNEIIANPVVTDGSELYKKYDIMWQVSFGTTYFFMDYIAVELAVEGGVSIVDMNKPEWQIKDNNDIYSASRNAFVGLNLAVIYYFPYW